jgi:uncharacterized heparinase superfamily protein
LPSPPDLLATVLAYDDARGTPVSSAPHSGYQRLEAEGALVLVDAGPPPPVAVSQEAHAGCLSFELSTRQQRIVVNCGIPANGRESWRDVARATAAHSTVTFNDTSSCRFVASGSFRKLLLGSPVVSGPSEVAAARSESEDGVTLRTSHDGYVAPFGIVHERNLTLAADGSRLDGEDVFTAEGKARNRGDAFAIRFHLHPTVKANRLNDGHRVMLMLGGREEWTFDGYEDRVELEESVYLAGNEGPRRTLQIVIYGQASQATRVRWSFARGAAAAASPRREAGPEPELPL